MIATGGKQGRPVIGLTTYREQAAWSVWNMSADLLPAVYTRSVEAAGGVVVLLPPQNEGTVEVVSRLDGLIISGGADVDPERYGQMPHPLTKVRRDRDSWEFGLLDAADRIGLPTLGICRGMQVMAVRAGGSLEQHLPDVVGHEEHAPGGNAFGWTSISRARESEPSSVIRCRSAVTIGNRLSAIQVSKRRLVRPTAPSKPSRIPNGRSGWACSGIPKAAMTTACFSDLSRLPQASTHQPD